MTLNRYDPEIWTLSGVLTPDECRQLIERGEALGFDTAAVRMREGAQMMPSLRNNDRAAMDDPALAALLWERVREHVPVEIDGCRAVGLLEHFRFYRYDPGQRFKRHRDGKENGPGGTRSRITFLLYLNEGYEGGETIFSDYVVEEGGTRVDEIRIAPQSGTGLFFVHHRWHEGSALTAGRKYVLRTDVLYTIPAEP
jgi:predicted 2-oxoglutarate/Fe(II)-dependent dioxygenase YbiX